MSNQRNNSLSQSPERVEHQSDKIRGQKGENKKGDAIKTGTKKRLSYYEKPFDEQMYEPFNNIRGIAGLKDEESE